MSVGVVQGCESRGMEERKDEWGRQPSGAGLRIWDAFVIIWPRCQFPFSFKLCALDDDDEDDDQY